MSLASALLPIATLSFDNVTFRNCFAQQNGGAISAGNGYAGALFLSDCLFKGNQAGTLGGAVHVGGSNISNVLLQRSVFVNNEAGDEGGAVYLAAAGTRAESLDIHSNAAQRGGGVAIVGNVGNAPIILSQVNVTANRAALGAGLYARDANATIVNCTITHNEAVEDGAAVYVDASRFTLPGSLIDDNLPLPASSQDTLKTAIACDNASRALGSCYTCTPAASCGFCHGNKSFGGCVPTFNGSTVTCITADEVCALPKYFPASLWTVLAAISLAVLVAGLVFVLALRKSPESYDEVPLSLLAPTSSAGASSAVGVELGHSDDTPYTDADGDEASSTDKGRARGQ